MRGSIAFCLLTALISILWLGYPIANFSLTLMVVVLTINILYLSGYVWPGDNPWMRTVLILAILFIVTRLTGMAFNQLIVPLELNGRPIIVKAYLKPQSVYPGDWVAYQIVEKVDYSDGQAVIVNGYGLDPVLGGPGDMIHFTNEMFQINGVNYSRLSNMPKHGDLLVPKKHWFIWPSSIRVFSGPSQGSKDLTAELMLQTSVVDEAQFIGKPFKRWFWREQTLP